MQTTQSIFSTAEVQSSNINKGNNWSYGYLHEIPSKKINTNILSDYKQFSHKGENILLKTYVEENRRISEFVVEKVRKQLQTVDCALAINVLSSLGGGTGSGLGTRTIQVLSQQFNITLLTHAILPSMSGQTPLQVYNCLLSLSTIQQHSAAIFPIENDKHLQYYRQFINKDYFNTQSLEKINQQIANDIKRLVKINDIKQYDRFYTMIVGEHVLSSQLKYLTLMGAETGGKGVDVWGKCMQELLEKIRIFNIDFSPNHLPPRRQRMLSGELIAINKQPLQYTQKYKKKLQTSINPYSQTQLQFTQLFTNYGTSQSSLLIDDSLLLSNKNVQVMKKQKDGKKKDIHQMMLVMNHSNISRYLRYLCDQGRLKFDNKAYLWHYEYVDIADSLEKIQSTLDQYDMFAHRQI